MPSETRARRLHYNGELQGLAKANLWELALSLLQSLPTKKVRPDKASFNIGIHACHEARRWTWALRIFDSLKSSGLLPSIVSCNSAIRAWTKDSWTQALQFLKLVDNSADAVSFNTILHAASWHQGLKLLDGMQYAGQVPDVISQNSLLFSLQEEQKWQKALAALDACERSSLQTSPVTYGIVLKLCKDFWFLALQSLEKMGWLNLESNVVVSGSIIVSCESAALWLRATELLQFPSVISCNSLLHVCGRSSRWCQALHLFQSLPKRSLQQTVQSIGAITAAVSQAGAMWKRAAHLAALAPQLVSSTSVISACENCGNWQHASAMIHSMRWRSVRPNVLTYSSAISALEKASRWRRALKMLRKMEEIQVLPNDVSYTGALGACEKAAGNLGRRGRRPEVAMTASFARRMT